MDYKKYSLENLDNWLHDAISSAEASPHEIYSTIRKVVQEEYDYHKEQSQRCFGLLELLSGHRPVSFDQYTEEELDAMCDAAAEQEEKDKCREYNLREAEYYNKRAQLDAEYEAIKAVGGYDYTPLPIKDKVVKWQLPVQQCEEDYYIEFPDDLLEAANLKEGDQVEWVDNGDGSYILRKI